jgi:hypothetical protein
MLYPPLLHPIHWSGKDVMIQSWEEQGTAKLSLWELFGVLIVPGTFHFPR